MDFLSFMCGGGFCSVGWVGLFIILYRAGVRYRASKQGEGK